MHNQVIPKIEGDYQTGDIITILKNIAKELHAIEALNNSENVVKKIIDNAIAISHADYGCLLLYNEQSGKLECKNTEHCQFANRIVNQSCTYDLIKNENEPIVRIFKESFANIVPINQKYFISAGKKRQVAKRSQIGVAIAEDNQNSFGVLVLESTTESNFVGHNAKLLVALAELAASALKNSQAIYENRRMIDKLQLLSEASTVLLKAYGEKTLTEKFDFIAQKTLEILDAELCSLFLAKENKLHLMTSFAIEGQSKIKKREREEIILEIKSGTKTGHTGAIADSKQPYNEFGEKHRSYPAAKNPSKTDWFPSNLNYSELAYPILDDNGQLLGLLLAYNKLDQFGKPYTNRGFSKEFDVPLMKILTTKLIISIKNAQLVNELEKYRLIIEATPDPVVVTEMDGTMIYMNKGAIEVFGDIRGKRVKDYYFSDEVSSGEDKAHEVMRRLRESSIGSVKDYETKFIGRRGEPVPVSATFSLFKDVNGTVIGTIGIVKDLREIKKLIEVGNSLLSMHEIEKILNKISDICLDFSNAVRAYVRIYDESTNQLKLSSLRTKIEGETFPVDNSSIAKGITGYVFQNQRPFISYNLDKEPMDFRTRLFEDVKSKIAVPINKVDPVTNNIKTFGVIYVDSQQVNAFSVNDMYYLSTLANQAAAAIENANLITSKTKIITELMALEQVQETITTFLDVDRILESVLNAVVDILKFDYATISRVEPTLNEIGTINGKNVPHDWIQVAWHSLNSNDIQAWVVRNKQVIKLTGWDDRLDKDIFERFNHQNLVRVYLPILSHDAAYGTLEAGFKKENRQDIPEQEIDTLNKVVNLAGIGIDQAYMKKEQQKLLDQLQTLNTASVYIQSSRTEKEAVRHIFNCLERIGYPQGMLSLVSETTGKIEGRYASGLNWRKIQDETQFDLSDNNILSLAIRERRSQLSKDCPLDPRCDPATTQKAQIKSQYVIPLIVDDRPSGTLQIDLSDKQGLVNGAEDVLRHRMEILETFASQIATALRNVKNRETINLLETTLTETAHEFRSPLHNILTQIGGLKSYLPSNYEKSKEIDEIFKIVSEEAHRAKRQMENTLMFTDRSRSQMGFNFETGYFQEVLQICVNNYRLRALERGIPIIIKDSVKRLPKFKFDKGKIEQVINNLVDNAIKYSHYNRFIQIQGYDDNNWVHIDIWDKGLGIPESEFDNIFKGFKRGTHKDKKRYIPGTGLGLKISKEIVTGHGGQIKVKSTPFFDDRRKIEDYDGYDTIFTIILPKKPQEK